MKMGDAVQMSDKKSVSNGIFEISGKVLSSIQVSGNWYTRIVIPAPDEYKSPATVEVRSEQSFANPGTLVTCKLQLGGFTRRSGDTTFVNNTLTHVS